MKQLLTSLSCLLPILLTLSACNPQDNFHAGRPITKEELASISAELFSTAPEPSETADAPDNKDTSCTETNAVSTEETTISNLNQIVFWLDGGNVYHIDSNCRHLEGSRTVKESTLRTAEILDLRPCKDCAQG